MIILHFLTCDNVKVIIRIRLIDEDVCIITCNLYEGMRNEYGVTTVTIFFGGGKI